ncbi:MAG: peptidylprolyl isomerase [Hyphomonadaceae bacterium]
MTDLETARPSSYLRTAFSWARAAMIVAALGAGLVAACGERGAGGPRETEFADAFIAAKVNGRPIYNEDVRSYAVERGLIQEGAELPADSEQFHLALDALIERRLFAMEAESRGLNRDPEVEREVELARERILAAAVYREIEERATDPATIERLYRENARRLGEAQQVQLRHIQFDTREAASAARRRIEAGERFEALAFELSRDRESGSEGGELGWRETADLVDGIRQAVDAARVGEVVGPVQSDAGWHLVQVLDRRQRGAPSLAALRPQIEEFQRFEEASRLRERLEATARIEVAAERPAGVAPEGGVTEPAAPETARRNEEDLPRARPPNPFPMGPGGVAAGASGEEETPAPAPAPQPQTPAPQTQTPEPAPPPVEERET